MTDNLQEAFRRMSGYDDRLRATPLTRIQDLCEPEDKLLFDDELSVSFAGQPTTFSVRFPGASKKHCQWVQITCIPDFNDSLEVISISGCVTNIDAQKEIEHEANRNRARALRQLRLTETRLLNFIKNAPFGILIMDQAGTSSFVNNTWFQLTGHSAVPVHDVDLRSVIFSEDLSKVDGCLRDVSHTGHCTTLQVRLNQLWTGGIKDVIKHTWHTWVQFTAYVEMTDGKNSQITTTITDITGFKFSEALHQARLEEALEARRQQEK